MDGWGCVEDRIMLQGQMGQKERATWGRQFLAWSAVMSYCGLLYYLSDQPRLRLPQVVPSSDTVAHVAAYAVLGWALDSGAQRDVGGVFVPGRHAFHPSLYSWIWAQ